MSVTVKRNKVTVEHEKGKATLLLSYMTYVVLKENEWWDHKRGDDGKPMRKHSYSIEIGMGRAEGAVYLSFETKEIAQEVYEKLEDLIDEGY